MPMRIGPCVPSNNTATATLGVILSGITTAKYTFRSAKALNAALPGKNT
jgi:hypothetical protein